MEIKGFDDREQERFTPAFVTVDMSEEDKKFVVDTAREARSLNSEEENKYHKDLAQYVKMKLDKEKGGTWHVIVGTHFGAQVTNESHKLIFFWLDHIGFLIFKHG